MPSVTDGIPEQLPALLRAAKVHSRSASLADALPVIEQAQTAQILLDSIDTEQEFGDLLLALTSVAREHQWDAEGALREAVRRRISAIRKAEGV